MFVLFCVYILYLLALHVDDVQKGRTLDTSATHKRIRILMQHRAARERYTMEQWPVMVSAGPGYTKEEWHVLDCATAR